MPLPTLGFAKRKWELRTCIRLQQIVGILLAYFLVFCSNSNSQASTTLRIGYVVPEGRVPQANAESNLRSSVLSIQNWYREQMGRFGFGDSTFAIETESDGITPRVHIVSTPVSDTTIRSDVWGQTISAASNAGLSIWSPGEVWLLIPESHQQNPDGSIQGRVALGGGFGSGSDPGVAVVESDFLFRSNPAMLLNNTQYAGTTVTEIGPHPLVQNVSFPWFEGNTFSSIASSAQGAIAHELGHAFGLGHDSRNDTNADGLLMGNGLRGWRGSLYPDLFTEESTQLGYAAALALSTSRYFNPNEGNRDSLKPSLTVHTSGTVNSVDGLLEVAFTASDTRQLAAVLLRRNGDTVAEMQLTGRSISTTIETAFYEPGQDDRYVVSVYDDFGNRTDSDVMIQVANGANRAPKPYIDVSRDTALYNTAILLDATRSIDPDGENANLLVEWDLDGDGIFETRPSRSKRYTTTYSEAGDYLITARLTDSFGDSTISAPISLRITAIAGDFNSDGTVDAADYTVWREGLGTTYTEADFRLWRSNYGATSGSASSVAPVPEPAGVLLFVFGLSTLATHRRRC